MGHQSGSVAERLKGRGRIGKKGRSLAQQARNQLEQEK